MTEMTPIYLAAALSVCVVVGYLCQPFIYARQAKRKLMEKIAETAKDLQGAPSSYDVARSERMFRRQPPSSSTIPTQEEASQGSGAAHRYTLPGNVEFWVNVSPRGKGGKEFSEPALCFLIRTGAIHGNHCVVSGNNERPAMLDGLTKLETFPLPSQCEVYTDNPADANKIIAAVDELATELEWVTSRRKAGREERILPGRDPFKNTIDGLPTRYKIQMAADKALIRVPIKEADGMEDIYSAVKRLIRRTEYINTRT